MTPLESLHEPSSLKNFTEPGFLCRVGVWLLEGLGGGMCKVVYLSVHLKIDRAWLQYRKGSISEWHLEY